MKLNRTIFFPNINKLCNFLLDKNHIYQDYNLYNKKIALTHYNIKNHSIIDIWKPYSFLNVWYTDYMDTQLQNKVKEHGSGILHKTDQIALFNYHLSNDSVNIDYMNISDDLSPDMQSAYRDKLEINQAIMVYFREYALKNNKYLIKANVHKNLKTYYKYYYHQGFELTNKTCINNQIEKKLI